MEDMAPGLIQAVTDEFHRLYDSSSKIQTLLRKVKQGSATYAEAQNYALEVSALIRKAYEKYVSSDTLPDGRMYYNIADRLLPETLDENYKLVSQYAADVQAKLNEDADISLKVQRAELEQDRIDGLVDLASNAEQYDDVAEQLLNAFENFSQHIVDETIRRNAESHYGKGLSPKIIRKSHGKCCKWCRGLAGVHSYPAVEPDVYRRHENCRCTVLYDPADGSKLLQNVHTKKKAAMEQHIDEYKKRERQRKAEEYARKLKRTFQAVPESRVVDILRTESGQWIQGLSEAEKRSIRKYTGNGDKSPKFYERLNAMLRGDNQEDDSLRNHANIISGALKRSALGHNVICYRGVKTNPLAGVQTGSLVNMKQFTSTSAINTKAFKSDTQIVIYAKAGTEGVAYVESLSQYSNQRELLFDKDCWYRVLSNQDNLIELEVL